MSELVGRGVHPLSRGAFERFKHGGGAPLAMLEGVTGWTATEYLERTNINELEYAQLNAGEFSCGALVCWRNFDNPFAYTPVLNNLVQYGFCLAAGAGTGLFGYRQGSGAAPFLQGSDLRPAGVNVWHTIAMTHNHYNNNNGGDNKVRVYVDAELKAESAYLFPGLASAQYRTGAFPAFWGAPDPAVVVAMTWHANRTLSAAHLLEWQALMKKKGSVQLPPAFAAMTAPHVAFKYNVLPTVPHLSVASGSGFSLAKTAGSSLYVVKLPFKAAF